jgi:Cu/Ag efflux protein CusF
MKTKFQKSIPSKFQPILWSKNVKDLDLKKDKVYIIHQILSYGNLEQIKWLFKVYKKEEIKKVFLKSPKKIYIPAVFYFIKNFILDLRKKRLKKEKYVKAIF